MVVFSNSCTADGQLLQYQSPAWACGAIARVTPEPSTWYLYVNARRLANEALEKREELVRDAFEETLAISSQSCPTPHMPARVSPQQVA